MFQVGLLLLKSYNTPPRDYPTMHSREYPYVGFKDAQVRTTWPTSTASISTDYQPESRLLLRRMLTYRWYAFLSVRLLYSRLTKPMTWSTTGINQTCASHYMKRIRWETVTKRC